MGEQSVPPRAVERQQLDLKPLCWKVGQRTEHGRTGGAPLWTQGVIATQDGAGAALKSGDRRRRHAVTVEAAHRRPRPTDGHLWVEKQTEPRPGGVFMFMRYVLRWRR